MTLLLDENHADLRAIQAERDKMEEAWEQYLVVLHQYHTAIGNGLFCQDCGIIRPPGGFYPLAGIPGGLTGYLCHECEQRRRDAVKQARP